MYEESRGVDGYRCEQNEEIYYQREEVDKPSPESPIVGRETGTWLRVGSHVLVAVALAVRGVIDLVLPLMIVSSMRVVFDMTDRE
jgi:hypothetical protein